MKKEKYQIIYFNNNTHIVRASGFVEAIVKGMAYAYEKAWDCRIKFITDEKGTTIKNIERPGFEYCK